MQNRLSLSDSIPFFHHNIRQVSTTIEKKNKCMVWINLISIINCPVCRHAQWPDGNEGLQKGGRSELSMAPLPQRETLHHCCYEWEIEERTDREREWGDLKWRLLRQQLSLSLAPFMTWFIQHFKFKFHKAMLQHFNISRMVKSSSPLQLILHYPLRRHFMICFKTLATHDKRPK